MSRKWNAKHRIGANYKIGARDTVVCGVSAQNLTFPLLVIGIFWKCLHDRFVKRYYFKKSWQKFHLQTVKVPIYSTMVGT